MKCPPATVDTPYEAFPGVDYAKIMALGFEAIQIDTKNAAKAYQQKLAKRESERWTTGKKDSESSGDESDGEKDAEGNLVFVCGLIIDIQAITKQQILKLRKFMPKKEYR